MYSEPIQMDSLQCRRNFIDLCEIYKYMNGMYKTPASSYFSKPVRAFEGTVKSNGCEKKK